MVSKAVLLLLLAMLISASADAKTYVCDVNTVSDFGDGVMNPRDSWPGAWEDYKVIFDDDTGILKYGNKGAWFENKMTVLQKGTQDNNAIGVLSSKNEIVSRIYTIRISPWDKKIPFVFDFNGTFLVGNCEAFGN